MPRLTYRLPASTPSSQVRSSSGSSECKPGGEPVGDRVLQPDRLLQGRGAHDAEHRPEELGEVEVAAVGDAGADARAPEPAAVVQLASAAAASARPSPSVVRASLSLPLAGSMIGPIWRRRVVRVADPQRRRRRRPAGRWKRCDRATEPTRITRLAAEHFCPAWPNADFTTSATARSRSALGVTMMAFLPLVSASSGRSGRQERNSSAVSYPPVRMTRSTRGCGDQLSGRGRARAGRPACSTSRGTPASPERLDHDRAASAGPASRA